MRHHRQAISFFKFKQYSSLTYCLTGVQDNESWKKGFVSLCSLFLIVYLFITKVYTSLPAFSAILNMQISLVQDLWFFKATTIERISHC